MTGAQQSVDVDTLAEIIAENMAAAESDVICFVCNDTGIINHGDKGWGVGQRCRCAAGRDNA